MHPTGLGKNLAVEAPLASASLATGGAGGMTTQGPFTVPVNCAMIPACQGLLPLRDTSLQVKVYREEDRRWLADIPALPGVTAYGRTKREAMAAAEALALRLIADRLEHGEAVPSELQVSFVAPCVAP